MIVRRLFSLLALLCAGAALSIAAAAQPAPGPSPSPVKTPTPVPGMIGAGTLTLTTLMLNALGRHPMPSSSDAAASPTPTPSPAPPMSLTVNVAFEVKSLKFRIDVPSIALSGLGPAMAGMAPPFPAGGVTAVVDYSTWKMIIWVPSTKKYFVGDIPKPAFGKAATPKATAMPMPPMDPFAAFSMFKGVKTFSIALTGHSTANGHPTSQYDLAFEQENSAGNTVSVHGQMQLADDVNELPVLFAMSVKGTKVPETSLRYDVTSLTRQLPPESDFHPPGGYKRAKNPGDAFK